MSYVRLSVGQAQLDRQVEINVYDLEDRSAAVQAGAGGRFHVGKRKRLAIRVDGSWLRTDLFNERVTHASAAVGVAYRIVPGP